jgi:type I restriction enzyme M protein
MLDSQTKKRIDDCRDILVGKLPDPKAQIEQITIGLIYKFMDDMDKEAIELGGNVKFFADYKIPDPEFPTDRKQDKLIEFSKYRWDKLFDSKVTATEMLQLYSEAITGMDKNPNIPALFRDIFKNAYLPYRDPETLKMFLKTINEFEYSHSEKLGDAFEYLLSVMGSQGDAGQFRTPRHIIDFVTACVNPQKHETVLDPACGTAGFLLSAYKKINLNLDSVDFFDYMINKDKNQGKSFDQINHGSDQLTPDERKRLAQNIVGYDISPDMVRLSLVNMYLHGFATPLIHEYDSLSSEERWNETYDVILANPPFMTPKGGIRPHKRFGVQANKAEVLFTDYIAEHLNPNGRAGIVVPNGIVATSQTAYKQLRKMLVQDSLIAVISLPAGVFQPYSGVKTSVLILDKRLAKKSQHILFLKIDNDGFDLGAQRREIDKNDLPLALQTLEAYKNYLVMLNDSEACAFEDLPSLATLVEKETVLSNKDIVLTAERYFEKQLSQTEFEIIKIGDVFKTSSGGTPLRNKTEYYENGSIPWLKSGEVAQGYIYQAEEFITEEGLKNSSAKLFPVNSVLVAMYGATAGQVGILKFEATTNQAVCAIYPNEKAIPEYLYWILKQQTQAFVALSGGGGQPNISQQIIKDFEIPLPPLEIQQQIVAEIEGYQKIIDGAKQVVNNYKPTISINPDWEMVELGEVADFKNGLNYTKDDKGVSIKVIGVGDFKNYFYPRIETLETIVIGEKIPKGILLEENDLIFVRSNGNKELVGRCMIIPELKEDVSFSGFSIRLRFNNNECLPPFYCHLFRTDFFRKALSGKEGANISNISQEVLRLIQIPLPPIEEQQTIVKAIEVEMQLVNANKRLIAIFEQKIKTKIGEVWGVKEEEEPELLIAAEPEVEYLKSK